MNIILLNGDSLYSILTNLVSKDLLLLTDIPEAVSVHNKIYNLQYSESFTGDVFITCNDEPFSTLENAFDKIFSYSELNYNYALLTIGCNTVAIFKEYELMFKIFDSHSRDLYGMPNSFGKSILITIHGIQNLTTYFQKVSTKCLLPFEIKGVSFFLK